MIFKTEEGFMIVAGTARELAALQELRRDLAGAGVDCDYQSDPSEVGRDGIGLLIYDERARLARESAPSAIGEW
jgi:hypothetical protein